MHFVNMFLLEEVDGKPVDSLTLKASSFSKS